MSILKANKFQSLLGNSLNFPVQVQHFVLRNQRLSSSSGTPAKFMENSITTKLDNSNILIQVLLPHGSYNQDVDLAAALGWATTTSSVPTGYTSLHGSYSREVISGLGSFWAQDTSEPGGGSWNGGYFVVPRFHQTLHSPARTAGTTLYYSLWVQSGDGGMYWGSAYSGSTDNGQDATMTIWEIGT
jgi:hypothetical protein